jgi:hypothetical protein
VRVIRPASSADLAEWVSSSRERFGDEGFPVVTGQGADNPPGDLDSQPRLAVSLGHLSRVLDFRPRDLTISVEAGMRMSELAGVLDEAGLWLPLAAGAEERSVGGWVAAAPVGRFDHGFGPVRRHVLSCDLVHWNGTVTRWGRPVMKNVAGYDVVKLLCGSRGRLGLLTAVSLRLWPKPRAYREFELRGEILRDPKSLSNGAPPLDAVSWSSMPRAGTSPAASACLVGGSASVEGRAEGLERWAADADLEIREVEPATGPTSERPARPGTSAVYRVAFGRRYLVGGLKDLVRRVEHETDAWRLDAAPASGVVRLLTEDQAAAGRRQAPPWLATLGDASAGTRESTSALAGPAVRIERGGEAEHALARRMRSAGAREIERRWLGAFGGIAVPWQADYL